jgi:hypothetical protein
MIVIPSALLRTRLQSRTKTFEKWFLLSLYHSHRGERLFTFCGSLRPYVKIEREQTNNLPPRELRYLLLF